MDVRTVSTYLKVIIVLSLVYRTKLLSQSPQSPCPDVFQYRQVNGKWFGFLRRPSVGYGTEIALKISLSIKADLPSGYTGYIHLKGGKKQALSSILKGNHIYYEVIFPQEDPLPKVTEILFNGRSVCIGPSEINNFKETVTNYYLYDSYNSAEEIIQDYEEAEEKRWKQFLGDAYYYEPAIEWKAIINNGHSELPATLSIIKDPAHNNNRFEIDKPNKNNNIDNDRRKIQPPQLGNQGNQGNQQTNKPNLENDASISCGTVSANTLYIKGSDTKKGEWPWMVAIYVERISSLDFRCAGTLVSHRHVVTAAHCLHNREGNPLVAEKVITKVGAFNLQNWFDPDVISVAVSKIFNHPNYSGGTNQLSDISIIELNKYVPFNKFITPACLWNLNDDLKYVVGRKGTVVGWGRDEYGLLVTPEPRQGFLPIVSTQTCRASSPLFGKLTSDTTLCAGARDGTGPCNGDSGGGMFLNINNQWYLRGIVSVSLSGTNSPCNLREYVVFTDTAKFSQWILTIVSSRS